MSERSEFVSSPDLCLTTPGTPKGLRTCGRLLLLTFLGEARKVSSCRATPGEGLIEERTTFINAQQASRNNRTKKAANKGGLFIIQ
ncbi:hypothetical protein [Herbaspirillum sp. NPDC101397]|uniref:hypothetical protein n=1 Tax=Herbaspirillum sp. NPDC101397 TaxID=3364006 RepID=UPI003839ECF0